jgi:hypothetical protein
VLLALPVHFAVGYRAKWLLKFLITGFLVFVGMVLYFAWSH